MRFCDAVPVELSPVARDPDLVVVADVELLEVPLMVLLAPVGVFPMNPSALLVVLLADDPVLEAEVD